MSEPASSTMKRGAERQISKDDDDEIEVRRCFHSFLQLGILTWGRKLKTLVRVSKRQMTLSSQSDSESQSH